MSAVRIIALIVVVASVLSAAPGRAESGRPDWKPKPDQTWQLQLQGTVDTRHDADVYDIDLVDTPQAVIDALHREGRFVVCYFSAGSSEDFRRDVGLFDPSVMGRPLDGWPGERWLDIRSPAVHRFMTEQRLDLAVAKDCDGVDPDNVDGYANDSGFPLTPEDQLAFNRFLATEAHRRDLKVGLKNDLDQVADLAVHFDFAVNEQCHAYGECEMLRPFAAGGKPIFNVEYRSDYRRDRNGARQAMCGSARALPMRSLVLPLALDNGFRFSCD